MAKHLNLKSIVVWTRNGATIQPTEHNRSELSVSDERIKSSDRMNNGRLRQYYVADKRTWSLSWSMIPAPSEETVDGKAGGSAIENFYRSTPGEFTMRIQHADTDLDETVTVVFSNFSKVHARRGAFDFWDVSVSLEEV